MAKTRRKVNSRRKGHQYERDTARWYRELDLGFNVWRGLQSRDGSEAADVEGDDSFPLTVECKHVKSLGLTSRAWRQAVKCAKVSGKVPVVHLHETNGDHLVVISRALWGQVLTIENAYKNRQSANGSKGERIER